MTDSRTDVSAGADQPGTPVARIEHQIPGRVRFRVPSKRGDAAFLARVADALREQAGIMAVATDARTGSVLVEHGMGTEGVVSVAAEKALFHVTGKQDRQRAQAAALTMAAGGRSPKATALSVTAVGFAAMGTLQLARGHLTGTTVDSFWKAYGAYRIGLPWASAALIASGLYALANRRVLGPATSLLYYGVSARHLAQTADRSGGSPQK